MELLNKETIIDDNAFPYLDMQLSWKQDNCMPSLISICSSLRNRTTVARRTKRSSMLTKKAATADLYSNRCQQGVFTRLGRLTSLTESNQNAPILDLYPLHQEALNKANLLPKN
eukprot:2573472-Ditylum_brightwellii.AAC.1